MTLRIYLVGGLNGGAGRSLTAALLAYGLHLQGRSALLVQQTCEGGVSEIDTLATTLPLPCCQLALPAPYALPDDLSPGMRMMVERMDTRFMDALQRLAFAEAGDDADVVVDLCSNERSLNTAAMRDAALLVLPVRTSPLEIDCAVRSFAHARDIQRYRELVTPTLLATIAPEAECNHQRELLGKLLRDCDPDRDLLPGDPSRVMLDAPFLDQATLIELCDEGPIWERTDVVTRCRAFAEIVAAQADEFLAMLEEAIDNEP